jgi:hypothetical protein
VFLDIIVGSCKDRILRFHRTRVCHLEKIESCRVDAAYNPIDVGDMLTTSPTPGHAMTAKDPARAFGAVIGKALRPLRKERDLILIPIVVSL